MQAPRSAARRGRAQVTSVYSACLGFADGGRDAGREWGLPEVCRHPAIPARVAPRAGWSAQRPRRAAASARGSDVQRRLRPSRPFPLNPTPMFDLFFWVHNGGGGVDAAAPLAGAGAAAGPETGMAARTRRSSVRAPSPANGVDQSQTSKQRRPPGHKPSLMKGPTPSKVPPLGLQSGRASVYSGSEIWIQIGATPPEPPSLLLPPARQSTVSSHAAWPPLWPLVRWRSRPMRWQRPRCAVCYCSPAASKALRIDCWRLRALPVARHR